MCPYCTAAGVSLSEAAARQQANEAAREAQQPDVAPMFSRNRRRLLAEAAQLHGRYLVYPFNGPGRTKVHTWGRIEFLGDQHYPRCLRTHYANGDTFDVTLRAVRPHLQGVNCAVPAGLQLTVPDPVGTMHVAVVGAELLPDCLDICTEAGFRHACSLLMPGACEPWCEPPASEGALQSGAVELPLSCSQPWQVSTLLRVVPLHACCHVLEPCCSARSVISSCLRPHVSGCVRTAALHAADSTHADECGNPTQPSFWRSYISRCGRPNAVVCSPPPAWLDVLLPLAALFVPCVCVAVPPEFLRTPSGSRVQWLSSLRAANCLHVVAGHLLASGRHDSVLWVCVFRDRWTKANMLSAEFSADSSLTALCADAPDAP